jgi:hypothetical protein
MSNKTKRRNESIPAGPPESGAPPEFANAAEALRREIAEAAYYRAQARGFAPGGEVKDWLTAELEVLAASRTA